MVEQGIWIAVEGIDGAGKTSAIQTIQQVFADFKMPTRVFREPGGTALGEMIRSILKSDDVSMLPISEVLLLYAARVQLLEENIFPSLHDGIHVILDRHELSTFAYQSGGQGVDINQIRQISKSCMPPKKPDLTFFLAVKPELGLKRVKARGNLDHYEQQPLEFFQKIALSYEMYISDYPNVVCIDANQNYEQVQMDIRAEIENFFAAKFA